ncbi:hypothetical protein MTBBW1_1510001 [Desulfamplus magnetovallimortis]|uniref:Caspase family p20 domain-containing protein n=2 Tax=Desulfamplus magnetovallimortis TaxID=1246637 RepID=A0A1W1H8P7_9BACT|nr:hypothetical protein MTBBW1_1510001 [Desulfamplus magnetovallimortis]
MNNMLAKMIVFVVWITIISCVGVSNNADITHYNAFIDKNPNDAEAYFNRGLAWYKNGEYGKAITDCNKAVDLAPNDPLMLNKLAWFLSVSPNTHLRNGPKAVQLAEKAVALRPDDGRFIDTLAAAYAESNLFEKAVAYQKKAIDILKSQNRKINPAVFKRLKQYEVSLATHAQKIDKIAPKILLVENSRGINRLPLSNVLIQGQAVDESGIKSVYINDQIASIDQKGNFKVSIDLDAGQTSVIIRATDMYNNEATRTLIVNGEKLNIKQEKRLSLIIGNSNYTLESATLKNPVNDAISMKSHLERVGFDVIKYENIDQTTMKKAIDNFGTKLKKYDIGLFFYAGHGIQSKGHNYLIPVDAKLENENDIEYNCVNVGRILAKMESAENKTNIIILDACRNNPFERSWIRSVEGRGLAFMDAPSGSLIAYATSPGKTASDGIDAKNGLYTSALLKHIETPNINILQMFQRVRKSVIEKSSGKQTPWESTSLVGDLVLVKK